jgi:hypothetical protein
LLHRLATPEDDWIDELVGALGGSAGLGRFTAVLVRSLGDDASGQALSRLRQRFPTDVPFIQAGPLLGDFAGAGALALAWAIRACQEQELPAGGPRCRELGGKSLLLVTVAHSVAALEVQS